MKIIRPSEYVENVYYNREFRWRNTSGAGFGFPCDEHGNLEPLTNPDAQRNYEMCLSSPDKLIDHGVQRYVSHYREPAIGLCDCGTEVVLDGFTNTCENCQADYNSAGQRLAPREQWGEETGESLADIMRGGDPFDSDY